eukprot:TRINITY_DN11610_c0_g1_i2.p1 TRINITY_DN11610_c0_g1~~TRINITY_DN11610_c0_g1_i2.p1  ORF type:complete len:1066 (+),score=385.30 TRINITY_DN11610_c0_g1_i2:124-3198(+)
MVRRKVRKDTAARSAGEGGGEGRRQDLPSEGTPRRVHPNAAPPDAPHAAGGEALPYRPQRRKLPKAEPQWFPNLVFLALTMASVRGTIRWVWPDVRFSLDFTQALFEVVGEGEAVAVLAVVWVLGVLSAGKKASASEERPDQYSGAEKRVPNPLLALTPLPNDRPRFQEVVDAEWYEIANARAARGRNLADPIIGMACSGGGIRAGSYMAGAMETFESSGALPKVDYLSTVSGGGYTGSAFMTRDREAQNTVHRLVRRMMVNSDYLGVSSKETNTVAVLDLVLSLTAALANNFLSLLGVSIVVAEFANFFLVWHFGDRVLEAVVAFLFAEAGGGASTAYLQMEVVKWVSLLLLVASMAWVLAYGFYSAARSNPDACQQTFSRKMSKKAQVLKRRQFKPVPQGDDEDTASDDDLLDLSLSERRPPKPQPASPRRGRRLSKSVRHAMERLDAQRKGLQLNLVLAYSLRCVAAVVGLVLAGFAVLYILWLILSMKLKAGDAQADQAFVSFEVIIFVAFAMARGAAADDRVSLVVTSLLGLLGVLAALFVFARVLLWRALGCAPFQDYSGERCWPGAAANASSVPREIAEHCTCPPPPHALLALLLYILVVETFIREALGQALHDMYRRRLIGSFFKNGKDKLFHKIPRRPYFICNAALNNIQDPNCGARATHPFFLSKRFCGSPLTGYREAEYLNVYLSKGMAISGAALSTQFDTIWTYPMKMAMMLMGIDLGEWFRFRRGSFTRHYVVQLVSSLPYVLLIFASQVTSAGGAGAPAPYVITEPQAWLYCVSMALFVLPFVLMIGWGMVLQLGRLPRANVFLHFPMYRKMYQFFGFLSWKHDPYFYLADGGWFDYFGVYELLRRGTREIFMFDADADHTNYADLLECFMLAEKDLGVQFDLSAADPCFTAAINRKRGQDAAAHSGLVDEAQSVIHVRVRYPRPPNVPEGAAGYECDLWIGKLSLTGNEPPWLKLYALSDSEFPHHSVANQNFDSRTFRAYRELGQHVARRVLDARNAYVQSRQDSGDG